MLYITQLIYVHAGQELVFDEFEAHAIPIIANYNGELLFRIRPDANAYIEVAAIEKPYEIHLVRFNSEADFQRFMVDEQRKTFLHLKEQSIKVSILLKGQKM